MQRRCMGISRLSLSLSAEHGPSTRRILSSYLGIHLTFASRLICVTLSTPLAYDKGEAWYMKTYHWMHLGLYSGQKQVSPLVSSVLGRNFTSAPEISSVALGGKIIAVSDEFFAAAENLIKVEVRHALLVFL